MIFPVRIVFFNSGEVGDLHFRRVPSARYTVAISAVGFLYTAAQLARQILRGNDWDGLLPRRAAAAVDFAGDQVGILLRPVRRRRILELIEPTGYSQPQKIFTF